MKNLLLILCTSAMLSACAPKATNPTAEDLRTVLANEPGLTQPLLLVSLPKQNLAATLQVTDRKGPIVTWRTLDNVTLTFAGPALIGTRGLRDDLMTLDAHDTSEALRRARVSQRTYPRVYEHLDGEDQIRKSVYHCQITSRSADSYRDLHRPRAAQKTTERCRAPQHEIENTYWIATDGTLLKSQQWVSHGTGYVITERLVK